LRLLGAAGAVACLGGLAALTVVQLRREGASWTAVKDKLTPAVKTIAVEGAPEPLKASLLSFLDGRPAPAAASELLAAFPCLQSARVERSWLRGRLSYTVSLRRPVGLVTARSGPRRLLDAEGVVFEAPQGLFDLNAPALAIDGASSFDLKDLASFLPEAAKPGALPAPLAKMRFVSPQDGWQAELGDGTTLQWGDLRFTRQKFQRLGEILADARAQFGGAAGADLRYFEDGRVLVRPTPRTGH
jgi:hypothetical protein